MLGIYSLSLGILLKKNLFWFLTPIFLIFSFFSKQIPSVYLLILFVVIISFCLFYLKNLNQKNLVFLSIGILCSILLISSVFFINEIPVKNFLTQYIFYPYSLGEKRMNLLDVDFNNLIHQFKFIYLALIPLVISTFFLIKNKEKNLIKKKELIISMLFLGSIIIFIYYQLLTKNQVLIFFLIPISTYLSSKK